ncbi:MAG: hypothetical protein GY768_11375 [Planctomycetaceae bacterium]|nr:hypothetical protein [Planctomycetaceae bacterium]
MNKRKILAAFRFSVAAIVLFFLYRAVQDARQKLTAEDGFSLSDIRLHWLAIAGMFYFVGLMPMAIYWHRMLHSLGQSPTFTQTLSAFYLGHLGKYVPGKAMVVVIRTGCLRKANVNPTVAAVSVFAETLTMMAVGAFLAAAILTVNFFEQRWLLVLALGLMTLAGVPTWPPVFRWLVQRLRVTKFEPEVETALHGYTVRLTLFGWIANGIGWFILGLSLWAVLQAIPLNPPPESLPAIWLRLTAAVCLAVVAGFLSLLPGGIGVREIVLDELMVEPFGRLAALVSAVLLRLVWLMTEVLISSILYIGMRLRTKR